MARIVAGTLPQPARRHDAIRALLRAGKNDEAIVRPVHDKYYRLDGVNTVPLPDPKSHFGAGHQNIEAVLAEVDRLGIPRLR